MKLVFLKKIKFSTMNTSISLSPRELWMAVVATLLFILALIIFLRAYISKKATSGLTDKYQGKKWSSPLEARAKYPDVDVFRYRSTFLRLGLLISLGLMVVAMGLTTTKKKVDVQQYAVDLEEDIEVDVPRSKAEPPPPPPPPPTVIEEVPEELIPEEEVVEFLDQSVEENTVVEHVAPVLQNEKTPPPPPPPPPTEPKVEEIFRVVEQMPRFPGCEGISGDRNAKKMCAERKLYEYLYSHIKYPEIARENRVEGMVVIQFVVGKDGSIRNAKIVRDIGAKCGEEALRVINGMNDLPEKWTPGKQRGRPVSVLFNLPIKFELKDV